ncbi:hypothetical protein [Chelativorans oligotrophicus]|uniref:hypothetical protein n=1 Tax=Chelativorans oligotrophicus TaxID=449974 RepID=UPI00140A74AA|nr:hypothetical protein [Chelativorans oligotrophicus]
MASHRRKLKSLSEPAIQEFVELAARMHRECIRHDLSVTSDHFRALTDLNQAICHAIRVITGHDPDWMRLPPPEARSNFGSKE